MLGIRTLVLNASYVPISVFPLHTILAEDAITRVFNGTCHVVADHDRPVLAQNLTMNWPSVIARNDGKFVQGGVKLNRETLYYRDHGRCSYCEKPMAVQDVTFDHVVPQSKGGKSTWENLVSACESCNSNKGDLPATGDWRPKFLPYKPTQFDLLKVRRKFPITVDDAQWMQFLGEWEAEVRVRNAVA